MGRDSEEIIADQNDEMIAMQSSIDNLRKALISLMNENTGGTWGLPASHNDTVFARKVLLESA